MIDFATTPQNIINLFDDISNLNYLFLQLQFQFGVQLYESESVIIFDEIQLCPKENNC